MLEQSTEEFASTQYMYRVRINESLEAYVHQQLYGLSKHFDKLSQYSSETNDDAASKDSSQTLRKDTVQASHYATDIINASEGEEDGYVVIPSVL